MAPPCLGIGPPTIIVQAQPVRLCISFAASSIVRGSLSMFLYNTIVNSVSCESCDIKFLTSAGPNLGLQHRLLNPPYTAAETPLPAS
jgi:hypothetical protein